jgi:transposase
VEEVTGEPLYRDRVCGIDTGKAQMVATIRVPSDRDPARRAAETRTFGTTKREVLALADWLRCWQVPAVVMEATSDYGKGPFYRLEAGGFECVLSDAKQVLAAALSAHRSAAFDVHVLAGLGCDAAEVAGSGFAVVVAGEEAGERVDEVE